ncbi:uncharacterized protein PADG_00427 [Paracoccidioides brasiliensis Pb18]|uniref:Uncharacterized protein n=2 Tax=Paracoccidioides brasiliensis TaxID=121759 RepID=C1G0N7_PARBD|nr:uncharacterized protein PADG_00427 [Paracoccidioides brasiliensis Pb18]EEH44138.2 hypothetical protein PADG_00427 [Paracoccidioides brasiliensis Pb18]ODH33566.1 hypothetical protein ACO22_03314 [Paracoccidioides brasiliensis]
MAKWRALGVNGRWVVDYVKRDQLHSSSHTISSSLAVEYAIVVIPSMTFNHAFPPSVRSASQQRSNPVS